MIPIVRDRTGLGFFEEKDNQSQLRFLEVLDALVTHILLAVDWLTVDITGQKLGLHTQPCATLVADLYLRY